MKYKESKKIFDWLKNSQSIVVACHRSPDADSLGSSLALGHVLRQMGKDILLVSPDEIVENLRFLKGWKNVRVVDYGVFDFSKYDLMVALDSSSPNMVMGDVAKKIPSIPIIVIDHHRTNTKYGNINLVDANISSTAELLYGLFVSWKVTIDENVAECLLAGIIGDTGAYRYQPDDSSTLEIAQKLVNLGASNKRIILKLFQSNDFILMKFLGKVLERMEFDRKHSFVWAALPYDVFKKFAAPATGRESAASLFFQSVKDSDFGLLMVEEEPNKVQVSLRSRDRFDISKIAVELGGGGHKAAAGATLSGMRFDEAVTKVLKIARATKSEA